MYRLLLLATITLTIYSVEQIHTKAHNQVKSQIINFIHSNRCNVFATKCDIIQTICSQTQNEALLYMPIKARIGQYCKKTRGILLSNKQASILKNITLLQAELKKLEPSSLDKFLSTFIIHQCFDDLYKLNDFCDI